MSPDLFRLVSSLLFHSRRRKTSIRDGLKLNIRDDVKLVQLVRVRDCPEVVSSSPAKNPKTENSNLHGFEVHRPSSKGTSSNKSNHQSHAFSTRSLSLHILRNSSRHSVLMLLSLSGVTNLSMRFGFCAARILSYRCLVGSRNCCCHPFTACTIDVTIRFNRHIVSTFTSDFLRSPAQPTLCVLHL